VSEEARVLWDRALKSLEAAKSLVELDPDSSVSRSYYAVFHAVNALFSLEDKSFSKHTALRAAVHRDLVQTERWTVEMGRDFSVLMDLRSTADYGGPVRMDQKTAEEAAEIAERILRAIKQENPDNFNH